MPNVELKVFFASNHGLVAYEDKSFARVVQWDALKLDFPHEFLPGFEGKVIGPWIDSAGLADCLASFMPDIVIVNGYGQALQRSAARWAKATRIPTVMVSDAELRRERSWPKRLLKSVLIPAVLKNVGLFLTVGDANEAYYRKYGVPDERLIRCSFPIDVRSYDLIDAKRDECRIGIRARLAIPDDHKVVLMVGKLVSGKRQADLIRFSNSIQDKREDITVVLAGSGPDEKMLYGIAQNHGVGGVIFAGFVSPEVLAEYYCAADAYVHCSEAEAHSLAISEAIYSGLPVVVSSRCGSYGPTDDVRSGLNGFVYRCGDTQDLARRLLYVLDNLDVRERMSDASRRIGREHQRLAHGAALAQVLEIVRSNL
jgi:glycosyltransferase involved in cell wall biosynthesis